LARTAVFYCGQLLPAARAYAGSVSRDHDVLFAFETSSAAIG
jgi:hypothetical protein